MNEIEIHSVVDFNSINYYRYMVQNYRLTCSDPTRLKFYMHVVNNEKLAGVLSQEVIDNEKEELGLSGVFSVPAQHGPNASSFHVLGLHSALDNMDHKKLCILADTDTVMVYKDWDLKIEKMMLKDSYGIIASTYEDIGQPCSGTGKLQTPKNVPSCTWVAISPNYDFSQLRLDVYLGQPWLISTEEMSRTFNLPLGYELQRESGWQIAPYCNDRNIPFFTFINGSPLLGVTPTGHTIKVLCPPAHPQDLPLGVKQYNEEYQFDDGTPFFCHQRGSLRHRFRENPHSTYFYDACEYYLKQNFSIG